LLFQSTASVALRVTLARTICGGSYRSFAARLADSTLLQWFCRMERMGRLAKIPGKSQLQRYQGMVRESELREVVEGLLESAAEEDSALELEERVDLGTQFLDSTCVKLNIHYPTDWVLLRDAVRTLMKATIFIRCHGLKGRMGEPREFLKAMNRLSMEMTQKARRAGSRRARKTTLRRMKRQLKIVQAHERIIGGRQVSNAEKILSLYEGHAAVYVRGKAGADDAGRARSGERDHTARPPNAADAAARGALSGAVQTTRPGRSAHRDFQKRVSGRTTAGQGLRESGAASGLGGAGSQSLAAD
jgi:hypothetical protein